MANMDTLVQNIINILESRKGFSNWWDNISEEDQKDIINDIVNCIEVNRE